MKNFRFILLLTLLVPCFTFGNSFFKQYNFITDDLGIPQRLVDDITKDSEGFIWVATHQGIGRYDGYEFLELSTQTAPLALKNDNVQKLSEDYFKRLWIATEGGIDILNLKTYTLIELSTTEYPELASLMKEFVSTLFLDSQGFMWIATPNKLYCIGFDSKGEVASIHTLNHSASSSINAIVEVNNRICAGINNQVCAIDKSDNNQLLATPLSSALPPFSKDWRIHCMKADGDDLWVGSNRGLFRYHCPTNVLKRYRYSTHREGMLSQAYITDIQVTEQGHLIVSTLNGLNVYHRDTDSFSFIRQSITKESSMINCDAINCLYVDGETIWVGTESGGVNLLSPKRLHATIWNHNQYQLQIAPNTPVNTISEDKQGNLWLGFIEKGLVKWSSDEKSTNHYLFAPNNLNTLSNNTIGGILIDSENNLWAYTWGVGINQFNLNSPNATFKRHTREDDPTLEGDFISSACEDKMNRGIWFGSTRGVLFYDKEKKQFNNMRFKDTEFDNIHALMLDRKNRLWVGTTQGIYIVNLASYIQSPTKFEYTHLKYKLNNPSSTQIEKISSILEDHQGRIWLGGIGSGLYLLEEENNQQFTFSNYTTRDGLPSNTIYGMAKDGHGYLWITTGNGLSRLDAQIMAFSNYTQADGLPAMQFYWNGIYYSEKRNRIYLSTTDGLVTIDRSSENNTSTEGSLAISRLTIDGNNVFPLSNYLNLQATPNRLLLHERNKRFALAFTTHNYSSSNRIRYAYRLKGYEKEWNENQPGNNEVNYNNVPAGNYTLQLRATDELGHWLEHLMEIEVEIVPYFYKTTWFYLLIGLLTCLGSWSFYRWKVRNYRIEQALLEKKVEKRTLQLAERNAQLETMAQHVKEVTEEKITFFTNITHELRTPVTLIHGPIAHALKKVQDQETRTQLQIAERNSHYLLDLVNELMDFRKLDMDRVTLEMSPVDIVCLVTDLLLPFRVFAQERQIEIRFFHKLAVTHILLDVPYIRKAMVNLISNAIKFTPDGGRVDLFIASIKRMNGTHGISINNTNPSASTNPGKSEDLLYINVYDTGHGIEEQEMERIFDRFYQSKHSVRYSAYGHSGTGIGLFLCKKVIDLHGGTIYARNNPSTGASLRILLPLIATKENLATYTESSEKAEINNRESTPVTTPEQKKDTLLVVEDNRDMRTYIASVLNKEYNLIEAENGEEALQTLQRLPIDLIISDLMMPVMDGMELSRRVKEDFATSHIPLLMLTAVQSEVQEKKSFQVGVDEYLCKPFDEEILLLRVRNILTLRNKYKVKFSTSSRIDELDVKEESRDSLFMRRAIELMNQHYHDSEYNLECFVREMGYSKTLVNRKMQELSGQPIGQFMKNYRLNVALKMINENSGSVNVSEVAYAVGFNDPKYFTRCFKELYGYLPSSKMKQLQ